MLYDSDCLWIETTSLKAECSGYHFSNVLYPGNAYINHCICLFQRCQEKGKIEAYYFFLGT